MKVMMNGVFQSVKVRYKIYVVSIISEEILKLLTAFNNGSKCRKSRHGRI